MKEIKAYVRPGPLADIIDRLEAQGARDLAVTRVDALGALAEAEDDRLRRGHKYRDQYSDMAKVEIVCAAADWNVSRSALLNGQSQLVAEQHDRAEPLFGQVHAPVRHIQKLRGRPGGFE